MLNFVLLVWVIDSRFKEFKKACIVEVLGFLLLGWWGCLFSCSLEEKKNRLNCEYGWQNKKKKKETRRTWILYSYNDSTQYDIRV